MQIWSTVVLDIISSDQSSRSKKILNPDLCRLAMVLEKQLRYVMRYGPSIFCETPLLSVQLRGTILRQNGLPDHARPDDHIWWNMQMTYLVNRHSLIWVSAMDSSDITYDTIRIFYKRPYMNIILTIGRYWALTCCCSGIVLWFDLFYTCAPCYLCCCIRTGQWNG